MLGGEKCKEKVWRGWHNYQCSRKAIKDGYCKQHHPDTVKARQEETERKWKAKQEASPWRIIEKLNAKIAELEEEVARLRSKC